MTDSTNAEPIVPGNGLGALVTTGLVQRSRNNAIKSNFAV